MLPPASWPRATAAFLNERLSRIEAACREASVPFHDDAGVDEHLQRVVLASDFAWHSFLRDPHLLGPDFLQLMSDPRHADARAGALADVHDAAELRTALRRFRLREALRLIWRDVNGADSVETTLAGASVLAEACLEAALRGAEREVQARHGVVRDGAGRPQRLVVFALGKLGGGELNFSSDIDLVFAYAEAGDSDGARPLEAAAYFARVGQALVALLADRDADGYVYRVDLRLRPFGNAGRLALSFAAMEQYFQREGRDWERYAWIKARPVAGDRAAGARLLDTLRPFVFRRYLDYGAFAGLREMKALIDAEVARKDLSENLKLGPGGIREIEFIVQLVQLIRGGREPTLRVRGLLPALAACEQLGYIPAGRATRLRAAYRFLRRLENRVQMLADQQTHDIPADAEVRERLALGLGYPDWSALDVELQMHRAAVADEFAALMAVEARDDAQRAQAAWPEFWRGVAAGGEIDAGVLAAAGFAPAQDVVAELEGLRGSAVLRNMSARSRERLDRVMPALFAAAAAQPQPLQCLLRLLRLVHAVARRSVYLALLDEQPAALKRLSAVFSASAFLAERVIAHPLLLDDLFDDRVDAGPPRRRVLEDELARRLAALGDGDPEAEIELIQELRQSALFRIGLAFIGGQLDAVACARALAEVAEVVLGAVLHLAEREIVAAHGRLDGHSAVPAALPHPPFGQLLPQDAGEGKSVRPAAAASWGGSGIAIVAYGSFGGEELGFGSDLDLVFLYDGERARGESDGARPLDGQRYYARLAQRVVHLLGMLTRAGRLYEVDVRLRPDGSKGMLVLSVAAWESYQRERAWTWELQALVRARAVAGDAALARRFAELRRELLATPRDSEAVRADVVAMRARWRAERDRSDAQQFDLKQGAGGLVDLEFLLQALVLTEAARHPQLLASGNSADLIAAAADAGVLAADDARALGLAHAALLARAIRCTLDGRPRVVARSEEVEREAQVVTHVATLCGVGWEG
ncbi:MAG: bifunctional [glutamate--ammonia ligase]-adenylyl-L-tyrosine phosphorylase/[glutamate--ammonia-ligase] adenylyltransferase [Rhodanobacteraceae bacterium]|nr:bifunctional [glutamate--ammonia ligase]-adenylyl-L-tyrosine phosphorylase/[glutamate--ammonia-ligase] adenylyltransferase [Rhodanobacteraceae bacterium]